MHMKPGMLLQPDLHFFMLMGAVVVRNQMQRQIFRSFPVNLFEETQPLRQDVLAVLVDEYLLAVEVDSGLGPAQGVGPGELRLYDEARERLEILAGMQEAGMIRQVTKTTATRAAIIYSMEPLFAAVFAFILFGEMLPLAGWMGAGMILIGMVIAELGK